MTCYINITHHTSTEILLLCSSIKRRFSGYKNALVNALLQNSRRRRRSKICTGTDLKASIPASKTQSLNKWMYCLFTPATFLMLVCRIILKFSLLDFISLHFDSQLLGQRCFSYAAPAAWNTLPPSLQQLTNTDSFKRQLKTVLFERAFA